MNKLLAVLFIGGIACGCVSTRYEQPAPQPPRQATVVENHLAVPRQGTAVDKLIPTAQPVVESPVQVAPKPASAVVPSPTAPAPVAVAKGRATAAVKPLRVLVSLEDGNEAASPSVCKRTLQSNLEGALARAGFKVVYTKPAEVLVFGTLHGMKVNSRGSRVAWKGDVDLEVTRAPEVNSISGQTMRDVIAKQRFDVKSGDARSNEEAQQLLGDRLGANVAQFAAESVNKIGGQMRLMEVTVSNAWQPQDAAGYPTLFTQKIRAMKGVYSCRIVETNNATRSMKAEILYDSDEYPDGLMNRVYTMPELNIVR